MTRYNHEYDRQSGSYVIGREPMAELEIIELVLFHTIHPKLQVSLVSMGKSEFETTYKSYLGAIKCQRTRRAQKKLNTNAKKMIASKKKFKESTWLLQQYNLPCCWNMVWRALIEFAKLPSLTQKLKCVKEQILMRFLGCGWAELHQTWSNNSVSCTVTELLDHLVKIVILLKKVKSVPDEAPFKMPKILIYQYWVPKQII